MTGKKLDLVGLLHDCQRAARVTGPDLVRRLAAATNVSEETAQVNLSRWMRGRRRPDLDAIAPAIEACGYEIEIVALRKLDPTQRQRAEVAVSSVVNFESLRRVADVYGAESIARVLIERALSLRPRID